MALTNQRAILLSGWSGLQKTNIPDSIFMIDAIPHSWLFPRVSAVTHHGGASTTAVGLKAGVPSVIIPFFGDQPFWGQRIADLGVGSKPIPRKKLTAEKIANAIRVVLTNEDMRQSAANLGKRIQTENGIKSAIMFSINLNNERLPNKRFTPPHCVGRGELPGSAINIRQAVGESEALRSNNPHLTLSLSSGFSYPHSKSTTNANR